MYLLIFFFFCIISLCLWLYYKLKIQHLKNADLIKSNNNIVKDNEIYRNQISLLNEEILKLKENNIKEKEDAYDKGILKGKELSILEIQVYPYKEISLKKHFFGDEKQIKIGYKYMIYSNGLPCLNSHVEIFETISIKEIDEAKVMQLLNQISNIVSPNQNIRLIGDLTEFGKNILNYKK
jgi:hypothetical protein